MCFSKNGMTLKNSKNNLRKESWQRTSGTTKWDKLGQVGVVGQVGQVIGGRPGELKLKKIDPKQLPRIQSKLNVITSLIAQGTCRSYTAGKCSAEQAMVQMIAVPVTTARQLMHAKLEGRSNRQERGPHRSREQVRILKEVGTLLAALIPVGKPGQASAAAVQCLAEFGIYHDLQMKPQEAHHGTLCPQWKIVLNAMIESTAV